MEEGGGGGEGFLNPLFGFYCSNGGYTCWMGAALEEVGAVG